MNPLTSSSVGLALCLALCLSFSPLASSQSSSFIEEACANAKYKDLCISTLGNERSAQDASKTGDLDALALVALRVASANGSDTSVYIKKTLDTTNLEPTVEQNFEDCQDNFLSAVQQLSDSLSQLVSKDYAEAKTLLGAAITAATSCDNGLKTGPGNELELGPKTTTFLQLCNNAMEILNGASTKAAAAPSPS